jgi:hypothetical protein
MILSSGLRRNVDSLGGAPQSRGDTHRNCFVAFGAELEQVVRAVHGWVVPHRRQELGEIAGSPVAMGVKHLLRPTVGV